MSLMDSFMEVFWGYYDPTMDPCLVDLYDAFTPSAVAGFHSHTKVNDGDELNKGVTCRGDGPYPAYLPYELDQMFNNPNADFSDNDENWPRSPANGGTGTPLYLLVPDADEIFILDTNLDKDEVWPL